MVIPYRIATFKSANIFAMVIMGPTANLISGYTVSSHIFVMIFVRLVSITIMLNNIHY